MTLWGNGSVINVDLGPSQNGINNLTMAQFTASGFWDLFSTDLINGDGNSTKLPQYLPANGSIGPLVMNYFDLRVPEFNMPTIIYELLPERLSSADQFVSALQTAYAQAFVLSTASLFDQSASSSSSNFVEVVWTVPLLRYSRDASCSDII